MWFRKFLLTIVTILLGLAGVVFGGLFLLCLGLYLLWNSLGLGVAFFGLIGVVSLLLARAAMRRISTGQKPELLSPGSSDMPELDWSRPAESKPLAGRSQSYGRKMK